MAEKQKFIVRVGITYYANIEVEAESAEEAEQIVDDNDSLIHDAMQEVEDWRVEEVFTKAQAEELGGIAFPFHRYPEIIRPALTRAHRVLVLQPWGTKSGLAWARETLDRFEAEATEACGKVGGAKALEGILAVSEICERLRKAYAEKEGT